MYDHCGTTACSCIITDSKIICGNLGDSRAVLAIEKNGKIHAQNLSEDHKPGNEEETARIEKADGFVDDDRVEGTLAVSRALGDHIFKKRDDLGYEEQMVSAFPECKTQDLNKDCKFIIIACDGIWDCVTSQECVDYIAKKLKEGMKESLILENLFDQIIAKDITTSDGTGTDNMSAIIIRFKENS
jgi:serine/threonine protein phosphatase PrpC